jgi:hypothetical protein
LHPSFSQFDRTDLCGSRAFSCFRVQLPRGVLICFRWFSVDLTRGVSVPYGSRNKQRLFS